MAALVYPALDPVAFRLGPVAVRWYGLAYVAGFLIAWWVLAQLNKRWELALTADEMSSIMLAGVVGVILGGRLGYVLFYNPAYYLANPGRILALWDGGMSFHGGLAGALVAGWIVARYVGISFLRLCDIGAVAVPAGLGLGRVANFINGELWGRVSSVPWAMVFPAAGALPRHPSQLYEAFLEGVVLLAIMVWLARVRRPDGEMIGWMLVFYSAFRIFVEFFRQPDAQIGFLALGVTMGQLLTLPEFAAGAWLVWRARRTGRTD